MKLILFRHGWAIDREEAMAKKMEDSLRPLVAKGKSRSQKMAEALRRMDLDVDLIVSSPYVRAMQTAEIIFHELKRCPIEECAGLVPSAPPQAFAQWLKIYAKAATSVIAVGHEPQLSVFASWLLSGQTASFIELKKTGMISLEVESFEGISAGQATLKWVLQPKNIL